MIFALLITFLWLFITGYSFFLLEDKRISKEQVIALSGKYTIKQLKLEYKLANLIQYLHMNFLLIEKNGWTFQHTKQKLEAKLGEIALILLLGSWLAYFTKEKMLYGVMIIGIGAILYQLYMGTVQKVKQRKQAIILELPIILTKMTLLIEAGETISQAFVRCMHDHQHSEHPLHKEWNTAIALLKNGESFTLVIEKFAKRCSVQQTSVLSTYILLNYARGGGHFVTAVQDLMNELWEQRKTIARKKGEEASSKLMFPTIVILLLLMVLIVTPAIQLISVI